MFYYSAIRCLQAVSRLGRGFRSLRFGMPFEPDDVKNPRTTKFYRNHEVGDLARFLCCGIQHMVIGRLAEGLKNFKQISLTGPLANHVENWSLIYFMNVARSGAAKVKIACALI